MGDLVFDDAFVLALSDDNIEASLQIANCFHSFEKSLEKEKTNPISAYDKYLQIYGFLLSFTEARLQHVTLQTPTFKADQDINAIKAFINSLEIVAKQEVKKRDQRRIFELAHDHYPSLIPGMFTYEFLDSDYKRLQELINELRTLTTESKQIDPQHKGRLLKRIKNLQQELHKRMPTLAPFWGFIEDLGGAMGKFGEDVKPLTDRIGEILQIAAKTVARANGLPEGKKTPLLKAVEDMKEPENEELKK